MNTAIYAATNNGIQSHIIIGEKAYYFFTLHDSEAASDYGGYVFPPLCTYIFTDKNRQPIATIIIHSCKEPEMMDVDWNGKSKTPIIKPMFTRESLLGIPPAISMRELTLMLLKSCKQAHQLWSASFAEIQPFFDNIRRYVTLFNKTYFVTKGRKIPKDMDGMIYHDPIEGFIFIN